MDYQPTLTFARARDNEDPLGGYQAKFFLPLGLARDGKTVTYLAGNSLGLQPKGATDYIEDNNLTRACVGEQRSVCPAPARDAAAHRVAASWPAGAEAAD